MLKYGPMTKAEAEEKTSQAWTEVDSTLEVSSDENDLVQSLKNLQLEQQDSDFYDFVAPDEKSTSSWLSYLNPASYFSSSSPAPAKQVQSTPPKVNDEIFQRTEIKPELEVKVGTHYKTQYDVANEAEIKALEDLRDLNNPVLRDLAKGDDVAGSVLKESPKPVTVQSNSNKAKEKVQAEETKKEQQQQRARNNKKKKKRNYY